MDRRSFFGLAAGAAVAPAMPAPAKLSTLSLAINAEPLRQALAPMVEGIAELHEYASLAGRVRPYGFGGQGGRDRYVYRTGYPAVDALRSVSGVHRALMEKRMER
jgi:hypothetical protein